MLRLIPLTITSIINRQQKLSIHFNFINQTAHEMYHLSYITLSYLFYNIFFFRIMGAQQFKPQKCFFQNSVFYLFSSLQSSKVEIEYYPDFIIEKKINKTQQKCDFRLFFAHKITLSKIEEIGKQLNDKLSKYGKTQVKILNFQEGQNQCQLCGKNHIKCKGGLFQWFAIRGLSIRMPLASIIAVDFISISIVLIVIGLLIVSIYHLIVQIRKNNANLVIINNDQQRMRLMQELQNLQRSHQHYGQILRELRERLEHAQ